MPQRASVDLDAVLEEVGQFGPYQIRLSCAIILPILFSAMYNAQYVFNAADVNYRCLVPECESSSPTQWQAGEWAQWALVSGSRCERRVPLVAPTGGRCDPAAFGSHKQRCSAWVYEHNNSIVAEFNLACQEWKRTLVGTVHSCGIFSALVYIGILSDSAGRRVAFVAAASASAAAGLARSFTRSYVAYLVLEYLDALVGAGVYTTGFVIAMEVVGRKHRVKMGAVIASAFAVGQAALALAAYAQPHWRTLTRILYAPSAFFLLYFFFLDESFRWLYTKNKIHETIRILRKVAAANKKLLSEASIKRLTEEPITKESKTQPTTKDPIAQPAENNAVNEKSSLFKVIHSRVLMSRMAICWFCWVTSAFVYYGLSINAVSLAGNMYVNYALVSLVEIPGYAMSVFTLDRCGRKVPTTVAYFVCAICLSVLPFIPTESGTDGLTRRGSRAASTGAVWGWGGAVQVALAMVGKLCVAAAFSALYVLTSELFPTPVRHRALAACSLVARLGQIVAMLTPLLLSAVPWLPFVLFGGLAGAAALLLLLTPETLNAALPDTVAQAERLGAPPPPPAPPTLPTPPPSPPSHAAEPHVSPMVDRYSRIMLADKDINQDR